MTRAKPNGQKPKNKKKKNSLDTYAYCTKPIWLHYGTSCWSEIPESERLRYYFSDFSHSVWAYKMRWWKKPFLDSESKAIKTKMTIHQEKKKKKSTHTHVEIFDHFERENITHLLGQVEYAPLSDSADLTVAGDRCVIQCKHPMCRTCYTTTSFSCDGHLNEQSKKKSHKRNRAWWCPRQNLKAEHISWQQALSSEK